MEGPVPRAQGPAGWMVFPTIRTNMVRFELSDNLSRSRALPEVDTEGVERPTGRTTLTLAAPALQGAPRRAGGGCAG